MQPRRRPTLRREALAELSTDDLAAVVAAQASRACSYLEDCPSGRPACSLLCPASWHTEEC